MNDEDNETTERRCGYDFKRISPELEYCDDKCKTLAEMFWQGVKEVRDGA